MFKILLATDGSPCALKAAECVTNMFQDKKDVQIDNICVEEPFPADRDIDMETLTRVKEQVRKETYKILDTTKKCLTPFCDQTVNRTAEGKPAEVICDIAEKEGFNLVVVGSCGK